MNYVDYHSGVRLAAERDREFRARAANARENRDEPCDIVFTAPDPRPRPAQLTIGGQTYPLWVWEQGVCVASAPTPDEEAAISAHGLDFERQADGSFFIVNPRFVECGE